MPIPRLPKATNSLDVTITVNKKLLPYFQVWFQKKREPGETPEQFALRALKGAALGDYIAFEGRGVSDAIEAERLQAITDLEADANSMDGEVG